MMDSILDNDSSIDSDSSYLILPSTTGSEADKENEEIDSLPNKQSKNRGSKSEKQTLCSSVIIEPVLEEDELRLGQAANIPSNTVVIPGKPVDIPGKPVDTSGKADIKKDDNDGSLILKDDELDELVNHLTDRTWLEKAYNESQQVEPSYRTWDMDLITKICDRVIPIFEKEATLIEVTPPLTIVGDIHGQHENLLDHFNLNKLPSEGSRYLFLGDYVDRGKRSLEVILLLLCLKIKHPNDVFLLRGNHEIESINTVYGFASECQRRIGQKAHRKLNDVFDYMPIAGLVKSIASSQFPEEYPMMLCMHGGIAPDLVEGGLDAIRKITKPMKISIDSALALDLMWADPDRKGEKIGTRFQVNQSRGISWLFGPEAVRDFMKKTKVQLIVRAHQVIPNGYELLYDRKVLTLFSAPNYCGEYDNSAAVMHVKDDFTCNFKILAQGARKPN